MSDEHIKVLRDQSENNPVTTVNGRVYVTVDKEALDAAIAALGGEKPVVHVGSIGHMGSDKRNLAAALTALATPAQPKASEGKAGGEDRFGQLVAKLIHLPRYFNAMPETKWPGWVMEPHKDGEWVQFSAISAAILDTPAATLTAPGADK